MFLVCVLTYSCFGLTEIFRLLTDIEWKNKHADCVFYKWESQTSFLNFIVSITEKCAGGFGNETACSVTVHVTCFCRRYVMPSQNISHEIKFISYCFHNSPWPLRKMRCRYCFHKLFTSFLKRESWWSSRKLNLYTRVMPIDYWTVNHIAWPRFVVILSHFRWMPIPVAVRSKA